MLAVGRSILIVNDYNAKRVRRKLPLAFLEHMCYHGGQRRAGPSSSMIMDLLEHLYITLDATPAAVVEWLHTFASEVAAEMTGAETLLFGPHTFNVQAPLFGERLAHFETVALYVVDRRKVHDIAARQVALALTYLPLCQPEIGLDLRVWPLFPAALDTLKFHFSNSFTQANPVLSSAAALYYGSGTPMLACNRWLLARLAEPMYAERKAAKRLYPAWLEQYRALKGDYPADPRRGFRALLAARAD